MLRAIYILPTILGLLLAGPIHCAWASHCIVGGCAAEMEGGSCCHHEPANHAPSNHNDDGVLPEPDGPAPNCTLDVCRSSLSEAPRRPTVDCRLLPALAAIAPNGAYTTGGGEPYVGGFDDSRAAAPPAGRALCIAICSFLL